MKMEDFCRCTPSEFRAICDQWQRRQEMLMQHEWERTRMLCLCSLQPYSRQRLKASDIMQFPWDRAPEQSGTPAKKQKMSREEIYRRFRLAKQRAGLK